MIIPKMKYSHVFVNNASEITSPMNLRFPTESTQIKKQGGIETKPLFHLCTYNLQQTWHDAGWSLILRSVCHWYRRNYTMWCRLNDRHKL